MSSSDEVTLECPAGHLIRALRYFDRSRRDGGRAGGAYQPREPSVNDVRTRRGEGQMKTI